MTTSPEARSQPVLAAIDLSLCAQEPIHIPGAIQPHGAMVAILADSGIVTHASANLALILGQPAEAMLGQPLDATLGALSSRMVPNPAGESWPTRIESISRPDGTILHLRAHRSGSHICIDIEPMIDPDQGDDAPFAMVQSVLEICRNATSQKDLCERAVHGLKTITGFDRVMAYRFDEQGHGEVVAEICRYGLEPYLGLHYPAGDIPPQARRHFLLQRVNAIADSDYQPVPLLTSPAHASQLDLTHSTLRSVSPIHREYMRNMGTAASLTIALAYGETLWGMLVCHHTTPRVAGPELRAAASMISDVISLMLVNLHTTETLRRRLDCRLSLRRLADRLADPTPLSSALVGADVELLHLVEATGALLRIDGTCICIGQTPLPDVAEQMLAVLEKDCDGDMLAIDDVGLRYPELASSVSDASGTLLLRLFPDARDVILWFRPELSKIVLWGGNPAQHVVGHPTTGRLSPRVSFASWREIVKGRSAPWLEVDLELAQEVQGAIEVGMAQRTSVAAEIQRLATARDLAEQANQSKSRFLASMSHELRTPLNGILGYAQLLRVDGYLDSVQSGRVDAMMNAGLHLLQMINQVLDLSEIEAGRVVLQPREVDPYELAVACVGIVQSAAQAKGLSLRATTTPDVPRLITVDPTRLRQILLNLLGNAVKFTRQGSVEIHLSKSGEGTLRIDVVDTGPGIPAEVVRLLFQEFKRLEIAPNLTEGTGLGLAISRRLVAMLDGQIGYVGAHGGGSVFWLLLPDGVASQAAITPPSPRQPEAHILSRRVLVVDDVAMNREIAGALLEHAGHVVTCAEGGAEAVAAVADGDYDVVLMDVRMPGVDGLEATRRIRALPGVRGQVPVIALTAQAFTEQIQICLEAGMDSHLSKPFAHDALLQAVAKAAQVRNGRDTNGSRATSSLLKQ